MSNEIPPNPLYEQAFKRMRQRRSLWRGLRRLGCGMAFILWLIILLIPCLLVNVMVQREVVVSRSSLPEHEYRLFLLQSADERGFALSTGSIYSGGGDETEFCVVTSTRYLMWEGKGEDATYCNCYEKMGDEWALVVVGADRTCKSSD